MKHQITRDRVSLNSSSLQAITDAISTERARAATLELERLMNISRQGNGSQGSLSSNKGFSLMR